MKDDATSRFRGIRNSPSRVGVVYEKKLLVKSRASMREEQGYCRHYLCRPMIRDANHIL